MFVNINYLDYYTLCKAKLVVYKNGWLRETVADITIMPLTKT